MARWRVERKARELFWRYPWRVFMLPPGGYTSWIYDGEFESWQEAMDRVWKLAQEEQERLYDLEKVAAQAKR